MQSQVGLRVWIGPQTAEVLKGLAGREKRDVVLVPIAFTIDDIEMLFELGLEYCKEAERCVLLFSLSLLSAPKTNLFLHAALDGSLPCRTPNDLPVFILAIVDIAATYPGDIASRQIGPTSV